MIVCVQCCYAVSLVHGKMHSDWFNGKEILQGRCQHGEIVGYCYLSRLEKTLCKWDIYVPLVTKRLTNNNRNRYACLEICEYKIILFLLRSSCLHCYKLCQQMHIKLVKYRTLSIYTVSLTCWWMVVCIQTIRVEFCNAGKIQFCKCVYNLKSKWNEIKKSRKIYLINLQYFARTSWRVVAHLA
jgi:hypothetical protein